MAISKKDSPKNTLFSDWLSGPYNELTELRLIYEGIASGLLSRQIQGRFEIGEARLKYGLFHATNDDWSQTTLNEPKWWVILCACGVIIFIQLQLQLLDLQSDSKFYFSTQFEVEVEVEPKSDHMDVVKTTCFGLGNGLLHF